MHCRGKHGSTGATPNYPKINAPNQRTRTPTMADTVATSKMRRGRIIFSLKPGSGTLNLRLVSKSKHFRRVPPRAKSRGLGTSASQRQRSQSAGAGFIIAVAVDPVVAECAARSRIVESAESTSLCDADFDSSKASKNLFGNEPSLSAQGTGGSCGS
jgi:hypothetical protein